MKTTTNKKQTIDDVCHQGAGTFKESIKKKQAYLRKLDAESQKRINAHQTAQHMAWAA